HLPGPFPLHVYKTGPDSTEPGPKPEIFSSLLGVSCGGALIYGAPGRRELSGARQLLERHRQGGQSSLTHAEEKLAQLDAQISRKKESVDLGNPTFREIVARITAVAASPEPS
ncbi:hypothetical protein ACWCP0_37155, partial [Streptomyces sp. NPDC001970]